VTLTTMCRMKMRYMVLGDVNGNDSDHMEEEDHILTPTSSEVNVISQKVVCGKKQIHRWRQSCGETTANNQVN
jgi:hypothetical protein